MNHSPKPTIAAIRGACLAGAFELALACDITIASKDAFFGEPELRFGAGVSDNPDEEIIPNPDTVGSALPGGVNNLQNSFDPSNGNMALF